MENAAVPEQGSKQRGMAEKAGTAAILEGATISPVLQEQAVKRKSKSKACSAGSCVIDTSTGVAGGLAVPVFTRFYPLAPQNVLFKIGTGSCEKFPSQSV